MALDQLHLLYEIPLVVYTILGVFAIYQLMKAKKSLTSQSPLTESYNWFIIAAIFFSLWAVVHIYTDLMGLPVELGDFFHFVISHGMQVVGMICVSVAAWKTQSFAYNWKEKGED